MPTENTLKKSLESTFLHAKSNIPPTEKERVDLCCRSFHKCDAHKHAGLNQTIDLNIRHCDCLRMFRICLEKLKTPLSNELGYIYSINATKCYAKDHPIKKCIKFEENFDSKITFLMNMNSNEREQFLKRCTKYEINKSLPQQIQLFDVPFNDNGAQITTGNDQSIFYVLNILVAKNLYKWKHP